MDLMEFLKALKDTEGIGWSDDDVKRWIKELLDLRGENEKLKEEELRLLRRIEQLIIEKHELQQAQLQDHNSPYVKALTEKIRKLEGEVLDLRGETEKLREALQYQAERHDSICREYDDEWGCNCGAKKAKEALKALK